MKKVYVKGLNSCVNRKRDIVRYKRFIEKTGHVLVDNAEESDLTLLWTCAFRQDYRDNSLEEIKLLKDLCPELIVCGCLPDIDEAALKRGFDGQFFKWRDEDENLPGIFGGNANDLNSLDLLSLGEKNIMEDIDSFKDKHHDKKVLFADQFVKLFISEGCTYNCTYCAEILAFPKYRSFPVNNLISKCRNLVETTRQYKVVLWADSLGDYGKDCDSSLPELIETILSEVEGVTIGLEHLHPARFIEYINEFEKLLSQKKIWLVDIPIQSASNKILRLMNRKYKKEDIEQVFELICNNSLVTNTKTHVIVGFPGETIEDFRETVEFLIKHAPKSVLISGYMGSAGMPSEKLPDKIAPEEIRRRVLELVDELRRKNIVCNYDNSSISEEHFSKSFLDLE